jgi:signal transduction histidine kinase
MKPEIEKTAKIARNGHSILSGSKRSVHEFDACRQRLAAVVEELESYKKAEALLQGEQQLTEKIARGDALQEILEEACKLTERALHGSIAIIMLLDGNRLWRGAAPSLPEWFVDVDGFEPDPRVGTCSAAAARKERVITYDIMTDPQWAGHLDLAVKHGLRSGWATPILSSENTVLGTFALYWQNLRNPSHHQLQVIDQVVRLLAVAIQRKRNAEALQASEKLARGQAEALTLTLDALAKETDPGRAMEHVLRTITAQFNAHSCSVWLRDQVSRLMVFEFAFEDGVFKTKHEATLAAVSPSLAVEAIPTWAEMFRTQRPVVLEDIRIKPDFCWREHLLALGVITMLAVPMIIAGKGEGLIGIRFTRKRTFSAEEQELAQVLANQAMLAIQMSRLSVQSHHTAMVEERNRVARDIHDTLAQGFTGVIANLEAARGAMSQKKTSRVSDHLERAGELARESLREARRSVQALRPLALEEKPVTIALRDLIERMTTGMPMKAKLASKGEPVGLSQEWETNLLRIGQEILTNAIRHSEASKFHALLVFKTSEIQLDFRDNGRGFDASKEHEGFGVRGIKERVSEMGGQCVIQSSKGKGTGISILLPLKTASALGNL